MTDAGTEPTARTGPLDGFTVGVTSDRRSADLITALERRGAEVIHAPALTMRHNQGEDELIADTRAVIEARPELVLITTGYGMRRWLEVADSAGLGAELLETMERARILARGPKAHGAVRAAGLIDVETEGLDSTTDLVDAVAAQPPAPGHDRPTIAIQLHGFTDEIELGRLRRLSHQLLTVKPYRWMPPSSADRLPRLIRLACEQQLDAITFTSAPAAIATLEQAGELGLLSDFVFALGRMAVVAVGPMTASPLQEAGVEVLMPERYRLGAMIRLVTEHLSECRIQRFRVPAGESGTAVDLQIRGFRVQVDERQVQLGPTGRSLLDELTRSTAVVSRQTLIGRLPDSNDEHALEVAISRLRRALGVPDLIQTVTRRGYRLNAVRLSDAGPTG